MAIQGKDNQAASVLSAIKTCLDEDVLRFETGRVEKTLRRAAECIRDLLRGDSAAGQMPLQFWTTATPPGALRCPSVRVDVMFGEEPQCALIAGHSGLHVSPETVWE